MKWQADKGQEEQKKEPEHAAEEPIIRTLFFSLQVVFVAWLSDIPTPTVPPTARTKTTKDTSASH